MSSNKPYITHWSYNRTDWGAHNKPTGWRPVDYDGGHHGCPIIVFSHKKYTLKEWLQHMIAEQTRLCRLWVKFSDDTEKCVYWYEQNKLDL